MINYPKILVMTTAEYEAQKNTIDETTFVRLTDNTDSPLAIGDSLLDGGSEPSFAETFLTATDETGTLTNSIDIGSLGANGTTNLLSYEITDGTAAFADVLVPEDPGLLFNDSGTLSFTDTVTLDKLDVTTTDPEGVVYTTATFTVTAGTNVLTVNETYTDVTTPSLVVTVSGASGMDVTADVFKVTAGTNILTVDETDFKLEGLASGSGTALILDGSNNILLDSSSSRYKHDIKDLEIDSSKIYELKPKSFKFNVTNMDSFGLIAEEVYETIPELVVKNKKNEIESVMYNRLPILLLCELRKIRAELDALKK